MGEQTDKISGRVKQAAGVLTGDRDLKREGERQEHKGEVKGGIDDAVDKAQAAADDVTDKIDSALTDYLAEHPGSTAEEVAKGLGLERKSVSTRLTDMARTGEIKKAERGYEVE
jgi:uncharacterized protein YjbJ (UPF0337 family)